MLALALWFIVFESKQLIVVLIGMPCANSVLFLPVCAGNKLYPLIYAQNAELAPKFTGMMLQLPPADVISLIESPQLLASKLEEAYKVQSC